jgi:hypothetical protein
MNGRLRIVLTDRHERSVFLLDAHSLGEMGLELALGTLYGHDIALNGNFYPLRDRDWFFSDS